MRPSSSTSIFSAEGTLGRPGLTRGEVMPGLPKVPAAEKIDVDEDGRITGLF